MKRARQLRRMEARTRARAPITSINMVSLLDIFTILLLFLLVQAGDPEEALPVFERLQLPFSESQVSPKRHLVVAIEQDRIMVEGKQVALVSEVMASPDNLIPGLAEELKGYVKQAAEGRTGTEKFSGNVTIMGDRAIPFSVLKKVMVTCASQHFGNVSLAVQQREKPAG